MVRNRIAALTPKAFANFSPGFEEREPWVDHIKWHSNPERVRQPANPYRVNFYFNGGPKVVAALQPWAEISERLRR